MRVLSVTCEGHVVDAAIHAIRSYQPLIRATRYNEHDRVLSLYLEDDATDHQAGAIGLALLAAGCGSVHEGRP